MLHVFVNGENGSANKTDNKLKKKSCLLKRDKDKEKKTFKVAKTEAESGDMWKQLTGNNKKRNETETDMR